MHDCPECGQACGCSGDLEDHDTGEEFYEDCTHQCDESDCDEWEDCLGEAIVKGQRFKCVKRMGHEGACMH